MAATFDRSLWRGKLLSESALGALRLHWAVSLVNVDLHIPTSSDRHATAKPEAFNGVANEACAQHPRTLCSAESGDWVVARTQRHFRRKDARRPPPDLATLSCILSGPAAVSGLTFRPVRWTRD